MLPYVSIGFVKQFLFLMQLVFEQGLSEHLLYLPFTRDGILPAIEPGCPDYFIDIFLSSRILAISPNLTIFHSSFPHFLFDFFHRRQTGFKLIGQ